MYASANGSRPGTTNIPNRRDAKSPVAFGISKFACSGSVRDWWTRTAWQNDDRYFFPTHTNGADTGASAVFSKSVAFGSGSAMDWHLSSVDSEYTSRIKATTYKGALTWMSAYDMKSVAFGFYFSAWLRFGRALVAEKSSGRLY